MGISPLNYCKTLGKCELWCYVCTAVCGDTKRWRAGWIVWKRGQLSMSIMKHRVSLVQVITEWPLVCSKEQKGKCPSSSVMLIMESTLHLFPSFSSCPPSYKVISKINDEYTEVKLLDHMLLLFLIFWETSLLLSIVAVSIYIPTNKAQGFSFLHILANTHHVL